MIKEETQLFAQQRKPYTAPTMRVILLMGEGEILIGSTPDMFSNKKELDLDIEDSELNTTNTNYFHYDWE